MPINLDELVETLERMTPDHRASVKRNHEGLYEIDIVDTKILTSFPYVDLKIVPSDRPHGIIHVTNETRGFFPGYKAQFTLDTDVKAFVMHLSGSAEGTSFGDNKGGYICHPRPTEIHPIFASITDALHRVDGSFLRWWDNHPEVQADDFVRVFRLGPNEYRLEKASALSGCVFYKNAA